MIEKIFIHLIQKSLVAGELVLVILLLRWLFRSLPKKYYVVLWGLVGIRLLVPLAIESRLSLVPVGMLPSLNYEGNTILVGNGYSDVPSQSYAGTNHATSDMQADWSWDALSLEPVEKDTADSVMVISDDAEIRNEAGERQNNEPADHLGNRLIRLFSYAWLCGSVSILLWVLFQYVALCRKVSASIEIEPGIRITDYIDTAFVLGVVKPVIYIPSSIKVKDIRYIYLHEKAHLDRKDNIWKFFGLLILALYWFHPLIWLAFFAFNQDIEYACDEKVLDTIGGDCIKRYASVLMDNSFAVRRSLAVPLGIASVNMKDRIARVLRYKKAKLILHIQAIVICLTFAACFMTDPDGSTTSVETTDSAGQYEDSVTTNAETTDPTGQYEDSVTTNPNANEDARIVVEDYIKKLCMTIREDDTTVFVPEDFATLNGYIVSRYLQSLKYSYMSNYEEGIRDLSLDVVLEPTSKGEGIRTVQGVAVMTFQYDRSLWKRLNIGLIVTYRMTEDGCECIDVDSPDMAVEKVKTALQEKGLTNEEDQVAFVDSAFLTHVTEPQFPHAVKHAVMDYSQKVFSAADSSSRVVFNPEDFETAYGYLGSRYFTALRDYNIRKYGEASIDNTTVTGVRIVNMVSIGNEPKTRFVVETEIYFSWLFTYTQYHVDHEKRQSMLLCEFLVEEDSDGSYRCVEFNNVGTAYELREELKKMRDKEEAVRFIDQNIDACVENDPLIGRMKEIETQDPYVSSW